MSSQNKNCQPQGLGFYKNPLVNNELKLFIYFICHTSRLEGILDPHPGLNLCPRQLKCRVLATGLPENSPFNLIKFKTQLPSPTSHISSAQQSYIANDYRPAQIGNNSLSAENSIRGLLWWSSG